MRKIKIKCDWAPHVIIIIIIIIIIVIFIILLLLLLLLLSFLLLAEPHSKENWVIYPYEKFW